MWMPVITSSGWTSARARASATTSRGGRDREAPRASRVAQNEHFRSQPSWTLSQPRVAPLRRRSSAPPIGSLSIRSSDDLSSICTGTDLRRAPATATGSCPSTTAATSSIARYSGALRAAEHPATTMRASGFSRRSRLTKRLASASAWLVTVQVLTTHTSASARVPTVVVPCASPSWRIRSVSYWLALQPNVW